MSRDKKKEYSREGYDHVHSKVKDAGDTSYAGKEKLNTTGKLDPLVDPSAHGVIRRSITRFVEKAGRFILGNGVAMLVETLGDTTASMSTNVDLMFAGLPKLYELFATGTHPVLGKYDPQILNATFGDCGDDTPYLQRSQAEMTSEKIATQLTLLVPSADGRGNGGEDPQFGLFAAAYLTNAAVNKYGLKYYHFLTSDEPAHGYLDIQSLKQVFGDEVLAKVKENTEKNFNAHNLPEMEEIVSTLKKQAHAFAIILPHHLYNTREYWRELYGVGHVVEVETTEYLPYVQATLIGLTEGVFGLNDVPEYLKSVGLNQTEARKIQRAVANIPVGAQTQFENFAKLPAKGSVFAKKDDLWPMKDSGKVDKNSEKKKDTWL